MWLFSKFIQMNDKVRFFPEWVTITFILTHYLLFEIANDLFHDKHYYQIFSKVTVSSALIFAVGLYRWKWVAEHRLQLLFLLKLLFCLYLSSEIYVHNSKEMLLFILWIFALLSGSYCNNFKHTAILFLTAYLSSSAVLLMRPSGTEMISVWVYVVFLPQIILVYLFISYKAEFYKFHRDKSDNMFRMVFDHSPAGIMVLSDSNALLQNVNHRFTEILGYTKEELSQKTFTEIFHPEDAATIPLLMENARLNDGSCMSVEMRLIHKAGRVIHVLKSCYFLEKEGGKWVLIGIIQDITQLKMAEQQLHHSRNLEESNKHLQEFAYAVSHDLKEPVRTINSFCQLLPRYLPEKDVCPEVTEFLGFIVNGAKRMETQINDLLFYSKVGQGNLSLTRVNVEKSLDQVSRSLVALLRESNAKLEIDKMPEITADRLQIESVFQNLISNAIKYRKPGVQPLIRISAIRKKGAWQFAVSDNGIGIGADFLDKIFAVFYRLHSDAKITGTGIGLAVCRRIVKCHGGAIWVESERGVGSTFYFTMPIQKMNHNGAPVQHSPVTIEKNLTTVEVLRAAVR
jgi:PAS domain S-box-containing protein